MILSLVIRIPWKLVARIIAKSSMVVYFVLPVLLENRVPRYVSVENITVATVLMTLGLELRGRVKWGVLSLEWV